MRFDILDERMKSREERCRIARERREAAEKAEDAMGHRTRSMRPFEEHRCAEMPGGYRIRRYGAANNPFDRDILPTYVWCIVRVEVPDYWIDGDECQSLTLNGPAAEPGFCPWCGAALPRLPDTVRGWDGRSGVLTREDFT